MPVPATSRRSSTVLAGAALAAALGGGCATVAVPPAGMPRGDSVVATRVLREVEAEYWRDALTYRPALALAHGVRYDVIPEVPADRLAREGRLAQRLARGLARVDARALAPADYVTALALRWDADARAEARAFAWGDFAALAPATTPLRALCALHAMHPLATVGDANAFLFFLEAWPVVLERMRGDLEAQRARGYVAPVPVLEAARALAQALAAQGEAGPWRVAPARLAGLDTSVARVVRLEADSAIRQRVLPALAQWVVYLDSAYRPVAAPAAGLWRQPGGKALYRARLRRATSLDVTPEEAHAVGVATLRRVDSTLAALRARWGWPRDARRALDSLAAAADTQARGEDVVLAVQRRLARAAAVVPAAVTSRALPALVVREATPLEALLWPDGGYRPAQGPGAVATLLVTTRWHAPGHALRLGARVAREGVPGSHLAAAVLASDTTVAPIRRAVEANGMREGWAEYGAALAGELGLYAAPLDAYGRVLEEGRAAALLVVDTGLHYLGWSTAQARAVLAPYVPEGAAAVDTLLVEAVLQQPGSAGAALLGGRELAAMRGWAQRVQGRAFSGAAWHREVLAQGELPLPVLARALEGWLFAQGRAAPGTARRR